MPALVYFIPSSFVAAPTTTATKTAMLHKRDIDGGAVGVILILLTVGCVLAVFLFIVCIKQARARRSEKRGRKAGFSKHQGDVPLSLRTHRRTNARTGNSTQPVGLGISDSVQEPDLEAGPEMPAPTPPPPSYHTNSLRSNRTNRSGRSQPSQNPRNQPADRSGRSDRSQGLANRTMRSGTARSNRPRLSQSISQYLHNQARSASIAASEGGEGRQAAAAATAAIMVVSAMAQRGAENRGKPESLEARVVRLEKNERDRLHQSGSANVEMSTRALPKISSRVDLSPRISTQRTTDSNSTITVRRITMPNILHTMHTSPAYFTSAPVSGWSSLHDTRSVVKRSVGDLSTWGILLIVFGCFVAVFIMLCACRCLNRSRKSPLGGGHTSHHRRGLHMDPERGYDMPTRGRSGRR